MIVVVFRSRLCVGAETTVSTIGARMYELVSAMPGFLSYKDFAAEDGETVAIVEFENMESVDAWRDHPEHRQAQEEGRSHLFLEYTVQVCNVVRSSVYGTSMRTQ